MDTLTLTLAPERAQTRMLMMSGADEVLRAILSPAARTHPRAAATLLEGLSLWYQRPLRVVLCVDSLSDACGLALCDGLGFGHRTLHDEIGVALRDRRRRAQRLGGPGNFHDLRRCALGEVLA